jgi:stage V sporulation protein B
MVFPVITFPSAIFYSLAELLVPELTRAQVRGDSGRISSLARYTLRFAMMFSLCSAAVLFRFSGELGLALYGSAEAGRLIRALAPLVPIMYMDSVTDGMLRGLGQQMHSMRYNVLDSFVSLALVYCLLPRYAIGGYIFIIYFTEIFNFALSIHRLAKVTSLSLGAAETLKSAFCAFGAADIAILMLRLCGLPLAALGPNIAAHIALSVAVYACLHMALGALTKRDAKRFRALLRAGGA